jgi:tetrahydromethanopterin S-methyltransferase subunit B
MKQALKGFICANDVQMLIGDTHEMVLFLQTAVMAAGVDPYVEDMKELVSTLDEQVKVRFSKELMLAPVDADTGMPATPKSEEIFLAISPIEDITVH